MIVRDPMMLSAKASEAVTSCFTQSFHLISGVLISCVGRGLSWTLTSVL